MSFWRVQQGRLQLALCCLCARVSQQPLALQPATDCCMQCQQFLIHSVRLLLLFSLSLSHSLAVVCGCLHHLREIDKHVLDIENSIKLIFICISLGVIAVLCLCKCVYEAATVDSYYYLPLRRRRHPSDRSISQQKKNISLPIIIIQRTATTECRSFGCW